MVVFFRSGEWFSLWFRFLFRCCYCVVEIIKESDIDWSTKRIFGVTLQHSIYGLTTNMNRYVKIVLCRRIQLNIIALTKLASLFHVFFSPSRLFERFFDSQWVQRHWCTTASLINSYISMYICNSVRCCRWRPNIKSLLGFIRCMKWSIGLWFLFVLPRRLDECECALRRKPTKWMNEWMNQWMMHSPHTLYHPNQYEHIHEMNVLTCLFHCDKYQSYFIISTNIWNKKANKIFMIKYMCGWYKAREADKHDVMAK